MSDFTMPSLGADMDQGTLLEWLVSPGDRVHKGDPVAVVDTSKAAIEVEVFEDGVVGELLVPPGTTVQVGTPLARIDATGSGMSTPAASPAAPAPSVAVPRPPRSSVRATPLARRLADELGVDIDRLGRPGGLPVRAEDVRAAAQRPPSDQPAVEQRPTEPPSAVATRHDSMRATIAARMSRANRDIPHYFLSSDVDLGPAMRWLREHNLPLPVAERVVPAALLLRASALAAAATPELNGFWVDDGFVPGDGVHLAVATSLRGGGLLAPVLHDADHLSVDALMAALRDLVTRARTGRLRAAELSDPTLTVTNLGDQGADSVHGVIYPPQVALVGFGRVADRPWAVEGLLGVRPSTTVTLAADHRATDGFTGSRFLALVDHHLQHPEDL
ncbi:dihydrolipoamide acetyltransferase family protein [Nocardioides sp. QY071]|uniref:dihydrolipoamide acetyltransferase family protein n=1 Tax=Nocardioides sp. QY071 TaxID=3044187 RepID=UPI00249AE851|nr:dihydrolipoamide acetyltransferase family protein [Nocardioides sp. QY071]WGY04537.1 dihydrolipoamide acetyltransferase family protein [Nocardioides sp. QY071]